MPLCDQKPALAQLAQRAGHRFHRETQLLLEGGTWHTVGSVAGGAGTTASWTDPDSITKAFYQVKFTP